MKERMEVRRRCGKELLYYGAAMFVREVGSLIVPGAGKGESKGRRGGGR